MAVTRACNSCGRQNRIPAAHLADTGRCGACKSALHPLAEPLETDAELFDEITKLARVPVLIDFWAAWCGPCKMSAPEVARAAADMAGRAIVLKVDIDQYPQVAARFGVREIPNFVILQRGHAVKQQAGVASHRQLEQWLVGAASREARQPS
jgi:thioredoxin 2